MSKKDRIRERETYFAGDIAEVVNVAVAKLTPVHLLAALGYYSLRTKLCTGQIKQKKEENTFKDKDAEVNFISKDESQDGSNGDSGPPGIQGIVGPQLCTPSLTKNAKQI